MGHDEDDFAGIRCARCERIAPITVAELRGDGGGGVLLPVPGGWIPYPELVDDEEGRYEFDPDQVICNDCAVRFYPGALDQYEAEVREAGDLGQAHHAIDEAAAELGDDLPDGWLEGEDEDAA